jgi:hypothetical protein
VLRKVGILLVAVALGAGTSAGVAGCGEDRGSVTIEGGATGTETTTSPTNTAPTETLTNPRTDTQTTPRTDTERHK